MTNPARKYSLVSKPTTMSYENVVEALGIKVLPPEQNDNYMSNVIGVNKPKEFLSQTLEFLKNPDDPKNQKATVVKKYLLIGQDGSGRALLAYSFAKEANLPIVVINSEKLISEKFTSLVKGLNGVFAKHHPAVILFKKFEYINFLDSDKGIYILSKIRDYLDKYVDCIFFASVPPQTELPDFILNKEAFGTGLCFDIPDLNQREELINRFLSKFPHVENIDISRIARNTYGMNAGDLSSLFDSVYNYALREGKTEIDFECVDAVLSSKLFGYKKKTMTDKERRFTAYHEAGHVIAGYFSNPNYRVSKVEIAHRSESLGLTISEEDEDKLSYTKEDHEFQIIECYGGMAAERIVFNTNTSGVSQDLAVASKYAEHMVKYYGMNDAFGPVSIIPAKGCYYSKLLSEQADMIIHDMLVDFYHKTEKLMIKYRDALEALSIALLEKETLYREEIIEILSKYKEKD